MTSVARDEFRQRAAGGFGVCSSPANRRAIPSLCEMLMPVRSAVYRVRSKPGLSMRLMSRIAIHAATVALAGFLIAGCLPSAAGASHTCQSAKSRTIASSAHARVFQRDGVTYGCMYSSNRRVVLGGYENTSTSKVQQYEIRLAGRYVAFGESRLGKEYIGFFVRVFDLCRGKSVSFSETGPATQRAKDMSLGNAFGIGPALSLRLRATGQVAWIARAQYRDGPPLYEVRKREGPRLTRLAAGNDIDPASLALRGNRLTWRQAGRQSTSRLGSEPRALRDSNR